MFLSGIISVKHSQKQLDEGLEKAKTGQEVQSAILSYLGTHRAWYEDWAKFYALSWNLLTFLVLVLGALTSILTAVRYENRNLLIVLPAVSSLCAALLIQFRLKDLCRVRDHGRIATELLICKALGLPINDAAKAKKAAIRLREAAHQLELEQLSQVMVESVPTVTQDPVALGEGSKRPD